jgi:AraC-like DNA-binding protein
MKAISEKIMLSSNKAFEVRKDSLPHFHNSWHFHNEIELTLISKSNGRRFVGDHIDTFGPGDLVLLGSNLPHLWQNEEIYYGQDSSLIAEATIIHFSESLWKSEFLNITEMESIKLLIENSKYGILIKGLTRNKVSKKIEKLMYLSGVKKLIFFLEILHLIAKNKEYQLLASTGFVNSFEKGNDYRLEKVYEYVMEHLTESIKLKDVANLLNMSNSAFCRFFKSKTRKTFSLFVNQVRIGYACKLLQNNQLTITQICFESGFENYTYFCRSFKKFKQVSPSIYRKNYNFRYM